MDNIMHVLCEWGCNALPDWQLSIIDGRMGLPVQKRGPKSLTIHALVMVLCYAKWLCPDVRTASGWPYGTLLLC